MKKKITLLVAVVLMALGANAQSIGNPKGSDDLYIVKWDCTNDTWAASNDFEVDEAFTFAVDVTGTGYEDWLKATPTVDGATRGIAINRWTGHGDVDGDTNRLKQIKGNIYGATWNIAQLFSAETSRADATVIGADTYIYGQVFGFEYTADEPTAGGRWYLAPNNEGGCVAIDGAVFKTLPYTGTKTSAEFYCDDYEGFWPYASAGYAPSCAVIPSAVTGITPVNVNAAVVGHEYYNLQGAKLNKEPESGLFIETSILSNGDRVSTKTLKALK